MDLLVLRPPRQRVLLRGEASKLFELLLRQALECKWNEPDLGLNGQDLKENALNEALSLSCLNSWKAPRAFFIMRLLISLGSSLLKAQMSLDIGFCNASCALTALGPEYRSIEIAVDFPY